MNLKQSFERFINQKGLFSFKDKLLLAVSGGVDSVVLCELCKQTGYAFVIAHCNFQLRGEESERDEKFVCAVGKKYGVEVMVKKFETENYAEDRKISIQEAARELRYDWFAELINESTTQPPDSYRVNFLLTAHHADDNAETLLMNFCRGTGLHGLTGIPASINYIRRPLLPFSKDQIILFASTNNLEFVEDSSNKSSKYTRNLFRNEIIPAISKVFPQVKENLLDNINRFNEIEKLYKLSVKEIKNKLCRPKGNEIHIPVKQLLGYDNRALVYEIIADYGFSERQVEEVFKLALSDSGRFIQSSDKGYRIIRHRHWFIISPVLPLQSENIIIEEGVGQMEFEIGNLHIEVAPYSGSQIADSSLMACLDLSKIQFPLLLRKWKTGDYFYPLGMKKKKKLARFFIDKKLSKTAKEKIWVIEMNKKIVWIAGHRIDDRFKVTGTTKKLLSINLTPV